MGVIICVIDNINKDIESIGLSLRRAMDLTKDHGEWRSFIHYFKHSECYFELFLRMNDYNFNFF